MRHYKVNKALHTVFDSEDEVPSDIHYLRNWRDASISDWVLADDGSIIQVLRMGNYLYSTYLVVWILGKLILKPFLLITPAMLGCELDSWLKLKE